MRLAGFYVTGKKRLIFNYVDQNSFLVEVKYVYYESRVAPFTSVLMIICIVEWWSQDTQTRGANLIIHNYSTWTSLKNVLQFEENVSVAFFYFE